MSALEDRVRTRIASKRWSAGVIERRAKEAGHPKVIAEWRERARVWREEADDLQALLERAP